ncbi:hypothetical protein PLESTB_001093800 [Pleodorina starrii]|uniref:Uncharacterized protein n=1 Tax=Pleodorina starrii TaxID=330485 RepID=A0A9W6BQ48_9CHLO|nr:hypothetical protein PLESTB_001093800 [Pleodorina starrii]
MINNQQPIHACQQPEQFSRKDAMLLPHVPLISEISPLCTPTAGTDSATFTSELERHNRNELAALTNFKRQPFNLKGPQRAYLDNLGETPDSHTYMLAYETKEEKEMACKGQVFLITTSSFDIVMEFLPNPLPSHVMEALRAAPELLPTTTDSVPRMAISYTAAEAGLKQILDRSVIVHTTTEQFAAGHAKLNNLPYQGQTLTPLMVFDAKGDVFKMSTPEDDWKPLVFVKQNGQWRPFSAAIPEQRTPTDDGMEHFVIDGIKVLPVDMYAGALALLCYTPSMIPATLSPQPALQIKSTGGSKRVLLTFDLYVPDGPFGRFSGPLDGKTVNGTPTQPNYGHPISNLLIATSVANSQPPDTLLRGELPSSAPAKDVHMKALMPIIAGAMYKLRTAAPYKPPQANAPEEAMSDEEEDGNKAAMDLLEMMMGGQ